MTTMQRQQSMDAKALVEEELRHVGARQLSGAVKNASLAIQALGVIEIVFGAAALFAPAFASAFFVMLLGGAVLVSGVVNIVASALLASAGRFALGIVATVAGLLAIAHPLFGLAFLTALVGVYLIATGIARFIESRRSSLSVVNAIVGVVFGIVVLLSLPNASPFLIGLLVGINLIVNGIHTAATGTVMKAPVEKLAAGTH